MKRGDVYRVVLDRVTGSEQRKERPCVVVRRSLDVETEAKSPMTVIVPLSDAAGRAGNLLHVFVPAGVGGTTKDSRILCQQIRAVDKRRIAGSKLGEIPDDFMRRVDEGLRALLDL